MRIGLLIAIGSLWFGLQFPFFNRLGLLTPVVGPLVVLGVTGLFGLIYDLVRSGAEQLRLHLTLEERKRTQELLESANAELEGRVTARTADLTRANERLTGSLAEKDVLLKEVHHRVKNNLQVISSLLNLQSGYIKDPVALQVFIESRNRVRSMALIHEKLYQSQDLSRIDFEDYIKTLSSGLLAGFAGKKSAIRIAVDVEKIMLPVDSAVPCGLIVNELVTNCFKYAFTPETGGQIRIAMKRSDDTRLLLSVSDDGVGFPKDLDFRNTESLGMQLVTTLAEQLDGTIELKERRGHHLRNRLPGKLQIQAMSKTQILVVEDEGIVAKDLQALLRGLGYHVPATVGHWRCRHSNGAAKSARSYPHGYPTAWQHGWCAGSRGDQFPAGCSDRLPHGEL